MPFSVDSSIRDLTPTFQQRANHRMQELYAKQGELGMEPRDDSKLSFLYATGEIEDSVEMVARELCSVDYIHKNTEYNTMIEEVMREIAGQCKKKYGLSWTDTWEIVRFYVPTMLKLYCVRIGNLHIPNNIA